MKSPCELLVWYILPAIRSELAKSIKKERFTQKEIANKLGITPAAVSQDISKKRGHDIEFSDNIKEMINALAKRIVEEDLSEFKIMEEVCVICLETRKSGILCDIHKKAEPEIPVKCDYWSKIGRCMKLH